MSTDIGSIQVKAVVLPGDGLRGVAAAGSPVPADPSAATATAATPGGSASASPHEVDAAAKALEQKAAEHGAELRFRVDQDSQRVIVSVVDPQSGDVLMQMPSEEALRLSKMLCNGGGGSLIAAVA